VRTVYSHSRLASYENCPKQFHFRYVLRIPRETEGIEAFVGKRVHEVLERLYRFVARGLVPSVARVVDRYHAWWEEHFDPERIRIAREGTPVEHYRELGERCLRNYYRRHYPFDADETLGLEQRVEFVLDGERGIRFQGIVDRIARAPDGTVEVHDYKTGQRVPRQEHLDADRQLALYQLALSRKLGEHESFRLVWHYVARGQVRTSTRSAEQLESLRRSTVSLVERIRAEKDYEPRPGPLCAWCEYRDLCPAGSARVAEGQAAAGATRPTAAAAASGPGGP